MRRKTTEKKLSINDFDFRIFSSLTINKCVHVFIGDFESFQYACTLFVCVCVRVDCVYSNDRPEIHSFRNCSKSAECLIQLATFEKEMLVCFHWIVTRLALSDSLSQTRIVCLIPFLDISLRFFQRFTLSMSIVLKWNALAVLKVESAIRRKNNHRTKFFEKNKVKNYTGASSKRE